MDIEWPFLMYEPFCFDIFEYISYRLIYKTGA